MNDNKQKECFREVINRRRTDSRLILLRVAQKRLEEKVEKRLSEIKEEVRREFGF